MTVHNFLVRSSSVVAIFALVNASGATAAARPGGHPGAREFLSRVYDHYPTVDDPGAFDPTGIDAARVFTPALVSLIATDRRLTSDGDVGALDGDPLCDCQDDNGMSVRIGTVKQDGPTSARADVTLTFDSGPSPTINHLIVRLAWGKAGWRIADIETKDQPSLRAYLARAVRDRAVGQ